LRIGVSASLRYSVLLQLPTVVDDAHSDSPIHSVVEWHDGSLFGVAALSFAHPDHCELSRRRLNNQHFAPARICAQKGLWLRCGPVHQFEGGIVGRGQREEERDKVLTEQRVDCPFLRVFTAGYRSEEELLLEFWRRRDDCMEVSRDKLCEQERAQRVQLDEDDFQKFWSRDDTVACRSHVVFDEQEENRTLFLIVESGCLNVHCATSSRIT